MNTRKLKWLASGAMAIGMMALVEAAEQSPRKGLKHGECSKETCDGEGRTEARERQYQQRGDVARQGDGHGVQTRNRKQEGRGQGRGQGQARQGEGQGQGWHRDGIRKQEGRGQGQARGQARQGEGQGQGWHRDGTGARKGAGETEAVEE